ncbi:unnamed protein product [Aspergillus oryzae]|uniref:Unnamed protein product n=2 Tax=Aspergillus oryzae TaxID=5062 RepID=A0AAN4YR05_ASPOZ|nr:unnamed protein product [Aspergillus oryzae]GMF86299.1 unnamed protein product [Aspergillus oryzae]GMG31513.1 unnamed protein product [Aspergillus oryzae]GMG41054.1 unnamed protein product [Aspergillus oryzae var. brunneus]
MGTCKQGRPQLQSTQNVPIVDTVSGSISVCYDKQDHSGFSGSTEGQDNKINFIPVLTIFDNVKLAKPLTEARTK